MNPSKITMVDQLRPASSGKPRRSTFSVIALVILMVGVAALGSFVARRELEKKIDADTKTQYHTRLDAAKSVFDLLRTRTVEEMRRQGGIIVESGTLKPRLNEMDMGEATPEATATITDMLCDVLHNLNNNDERRRASTSDAFECDKREKLEKLRGMLVVLNSAGKVLAQAGAPELRGLDLSASKVVKQAQSSNEAVVGSWVIGNKIIDLSIVAFRFTLDGEAIAYLVVGQTIDQTLLKPLGTAAGVSAGIVIGTEWVAVSDDKLKGVSSLAQNLTADIQLVEFDGARHAARTIELDQMGQSRPRLVLVQSLAEAGSAFSVFKWLLWLSPLLVLIGMVLLAISRSNYRAS